MPRVKRGNHRTQRRKKILELAKGYRLTKSKLYRQAKESVERGLNFAYHGRKLKKRDDRTVDPSLSWAWGRSAGSGLAPAAWAAARP